MTNDRIELKYNLRWRIADGRIPLLERHLRSLRALGLPDPLQGWIRTRIEWAADNMLGDQSAAVLCLAINPAEDVVVSLDDLRTPPPLTLDDLVEKDGRITAAAAPNGEPLEGVVFCELDGVLVASTDTLVSATATLVEGLAQTLGFTLELRPLGREQIAAAQAVFLVSDEFGYVPIDAKAAGSGEPQADAPMAKKMQECLQKVYPPA